MSQMSCVGIRKYARMCVVVHRYVRVCADVDWCAQFWAGVRGFLQVRVCVQVCVGVCVGKFFRISTGDLIPNISKL